MSEQRLIEIVNYLLFFASACIFYGITELVTDNEVCHKDRPIPHENWTYHAPRPEPYINPVFKQMLDTDLTECITVRSYQAEYIGEYFVTAYTAEECGWNYGTASGEEVEWHEEWYIPTTAAIDPRLHSFYELLMIDGKVYICTDTGGDIKGHWIDVYVPDMASVRSWETGMRSVYSVQLIEKQIKKAGGKLNDYYNPYLYVNGICDWNFRWYGSWLYG